MVTHYNVGVTPSNMKMTFAPPQSADTEIDIDALGQFMGANLSNYNGEKFIGGFGETAVYNIDYWTLRARSEQLFTDNLYAKGLIRRLITNEINTGLTPEINPDEEIVGVNEETLNAWSEITENRWGIWTKAAELCDWKGESTFGALQQTARREALICGDVLVVLRTHARTKLPCVQLISGSKVRTPYTEGVVREGNEIKHGVEFDTQGRVVAYWVMQDDLSYKRLPAVGARSGKRLAWLVYGSEKRLDEVRGQPLLAVVFQSLKEIDRYRDSAQRKAVINSILAMFIKKTQDKIGTLPMTGAAVRKGVIQTGPAETSRPMGITQNVPGVVMQELQHGEEPVGFHSQGTDINFPVFEAAVVSAIAWANEMPPEILVLSFNSNYSASQAAINEFKIYLNRRWGEWGETFCQPIFVEWLMCEVLQGKTNPKGFFESWNDPNKYDIFGAWTNVDWYGSIKPSTDTLKQARGSSILVDKCWSTNARESRQISGTKYSKNVKTIKRENAQRAEALRPILELQKEFGLTYRQVSAMINDDFSAMDNEEAES